MSRIQGRPFVLIFYDLNIQARANHEFKSFLQIINLNLKQAQNMSIITGPQAFLTIQLQTPKNIPQAQIAKLSQLDRATMQYQNIGQYQLITHPILGSGATGKVFYGVNMTNKTKVAAKQIDTTKITSSLAKQIENQIKNLTKIKSPYIVKLYDYFKCGQYLYLFLEYCEDGDLKAYLDEKKGAGLCEAEALLFMKHMLEGYKQLYAHNIIHRDIKPANILLKQGIAKLSDFGFSRVVDNPEQSQKLTLLGSPLYTAIEILHGENFSNRCDVWSFGVVFYEILEGRTPWIGKDLPDLKQNIKNKPLEFKDNIQNPKIKQLIKRMLTLDSKERITWNQIFSHELFQKIKLENKMNGPEMSIQDVKKKFFEYMQTHMVKAYLRLNMSDVSFKESYEPSEQKTKQIVQNISKQITHKRNIAFLYLYVLALFYKNKGENLISEDVNKYMQFEYALILKANQQIHSIQHEYFSDKAPKSIKNWQIFKKSSNYEELLKILSYDFNIIDTLKRSVKKNAVYLVSKGSMPEDTAKYFSELEKNFQKVFPEAMKHNEKKLSKKSNGVSNLIRYYINEYIKESKKLEDYSNLDMGSFYQEKQKMYGLA